MADFFEVRFLPEDRAVSVEAGARVSEAAALAEILVEQPCGGRGHCGKCRVRFIEGAPTPTPREAEVLGEDEIEQGWRLACQAEISRPARIEVPRVVRAASGKSFGPDELFAPDFERAVEARLVELDYDALDDQVSLLERLARACGRGGAPRAETVLLRELAEAALGRTRPLGAVWEGDELRALIAPAKIGRCFGVALDVGTTTVAAALVDLGDGSVKAIHSTLNSQVRFGADVISRITVAIQEPAKVGELQKAVVDTIQGLIEVLCREAGVERDEILALSVVGNPTMQHLLLGVNPASLGASPYVGVWRGERTVAASDIKLGVHPRARIWFAPMVRSNVGGDTVAAMLATDMDRDERLRLLVDLGTNAEVVLGSARRRVACSTAAGPAFEGANISQGMRAAAGAIDFFNIHGDGTVVLHVIGDTKARGICGSGLIDAVAALLRAGVIDERGWLRPAEQCAGSVAEPVVRRLVKTAEGMNAFVLAEAEEADGGKVVSLTAGDVRQLQLVKGSIAAGARILCKEMGVEVGEIEEVLIAGAFGNFVRKESALAIGLVPRVEPERLRFVGNAAGIGARMVLADREARRRALALADETEYVELAGRSDYQELFASAMLFGGE